MAALILECDLGNSRCKWRIRDEFAVIVDRGFAHASDEFQGMPVGKAVTRILVASVAGTEILDALMRALLRFNVSIEFAFSQRESAGIVNAYGKDFARLGVDRWLAIVAAYKRTGSAVLVLDAGSALTADLVDHAGVHLGGYIVPGAQLMKSALLADTGHVRFDQAAHTMSMEFGCSTQEAVDAGILAAQVGAAKVAVEQARKRIRSDFAILVTGGEGHDLVQYLGVSVKEVPDLVLDGLAWVLP